MMENALIGYSGFVGSTLLTQATFQACYRSTNIQEIDGCGFRDVVCAGAPAQKWLANRDPDEDREKIETLIRHLRTITCDRFILISTVDVFKSPIGVDETTEVDEVALHPYGLHRRLLEKFVQQQFSDHLIVRLPGLVGAGLRKNVIFDFLNDNNLDAVDSRGVFQFYDMAKLWRDIEIASQAGLSLIHLTAEPISVADVAAQGFGRDFSQPLPNPPARYDMQTQHAKLFGASGSYQYSRSDTIAAIRNYAAREPVTRAQKDGAED